MRALLRELCAWAVVDATHPYAIQAQANARKASHDANIPYFRWLRAETALDELDGVAVAGGHQEAARLAFSYGCTVLLTVGSRNIEPYAREARRTGIDVFARVLPLPDSRAACREAGLPESAISAGRGPFSLTENRSVIRRVGAGVLVTKDGGAEGGMPAKLEAARIEGCRLVVVRRPAVDIPDGQSFQSIISLLQALPRLR
jgi:precorrin-6A/cobalt-precorrin-6A reductase